MSRFSVTYLTASDPTHELNLWWKRTVRGNPTPETLTITASSGSGIPAEQIILGDAVPVAFSTHGGVVSLSLSYGRARWTNLPATTGTTATVSGNHVTVPVTCSAIARSCTGSITLQAIPARGRSPIVLGGAQYSVPGGSTQRVTVPLNRRGRRMAIQKKWLPSNFRLKVDSPIGTIVTQHRIHFRGA
jgi:hypothetical protein